MKNKAQYKRRIEIIIHDLMYYALSLSDMLDWPKDENGYVKVDYTTAAETILHLQQAAKDTAQELDFISDDLAEAVDFDKLYLETSKTL